MLRFAREFLVAHRRVVDQDRLDHGGLLRVSRLEPLKSIQIRVVRPGEIVHWVLQEVEARNSDRVEALVIRPPMYVARRLYPSPSLLRAQPTHEK